MPFSAILILIYNNHYHIYSSRICIFYFFIPCQSVMIYTGMICTFIINVLQSLSLLHHKMAPHSQTVPLLRDWWGLRYRCDRCVIVIPRKWLRTSRATVEGSQRGELDGNRLHDSVFLSSSAAHKYCVNDRLSSWNLHVSSPKLRVRAPDMCLAQHLLRCLRFMHLLWFMIP